MESLIAEWSQQPGFVWLDSSDGPSKWGKQSIVACNPVATIWGQNGTIHSDGHEEKFLDNFLEWAQTKGPIIGYFGYETPAYLHRPEFSKVAFHHQASLIPDFWLGVYPNATRITEPVTLAQTPYSLEHTASPTDHQWFTNAVRQVQTHIHVGDIYQLNLTRRIHARLTGHPLSLYGQMRRLNPAPFGAYLDIGQAQIMSMSPERFFSITDETIQARPIKGTIARHPDHDMAAIHHLLHSEKDNAELTMIVDLLRNDLGRICIPGSITVPELKTIESYPTLHHLVATIEGQLRPAWSYFDIVMALFPGGSITGAPKYKAMELIGTIESVPRSVYTGAIGYFGLEGKSDFNIGIRTAYHHQGDVFYHTGCGIVADSDPESEWEESRTKARAFLDCLTAPR